MKYLVTCECGSTIEITAGQIGTDVTCQCGKTVNIPSLSELRANNCSQEEPFGGVRDDYHGSSATALYRLFKVACCCVACYILYSVICFAVHCHRLNSHIRDLNAVNKVLPERPQDWAITDNDLPKVVEIGRLKERLSRENWELIRPLAAYQSRSIDFSTLLEKTREPSKNLPLEHKRMRDLAQSLTVGSDYRELLVKLSDAMSMQCLGLTKIIEGIEQDDSKAIDAGLKLFVESRQEVIELSVNEEAKDAKPSHSIEKLMKGFKPRNNTYH